MLKTQFFNLCQKEGLRKEKKKKEDFFLCFKWTVCTFQKINQKQEVSIEVNLHRLQRLTWVDALCRCIKLPYTDRYMDKDIDRQADSSITQKNIPFEGGTINIFSTDRDIVKCPSFYMTMKKLIPRQYVDIFFKCSSVKYQKWNQWSLFYKYAYKKLHSLP